MKVKKWKSLSRLSLCHLMDYTVHGILQARILEWVAFPFSRGIFPTQGSNPGLLHCQWILYQLSHQGNPIILEWVAYPFSSESSWLRNQSRVSCIAGGFFTNWAIKEALKKGNARCNLMTWLWSLYILQIYNLSVTYVANMFCLTVVYHSLNSNFH